MAESTSDAQQVQDPSWRSVIPKVEIKTEPCESVEIQDVYEKGNNIVVLYGNKQTNENIDQSADTTNTLLLVHKKDVGLTRIPQPTSHHPAFKAITVVPKRQPQIDTKPDFKFIPIDRKSHAHKRGMLPKLRKVSLGGATDKSNKDTGVQPTPAEIPERESDARAENASSLPLDMECEDVDEEEEQSAAVFCDKSDYQCALCKRFLVDESSLIAHLDRTHLRGTFTCPVPGCGKSYACRRNRRRHLRDKHPDIARLTANKSLSNVSIEGNVVIEKSIPVSKHRISGWTPPVKPQPVLEVICPYPDCPEIFESNRRLYRHLSIAHAVDPDNHVPLHRKLQMSSTEGNVARNRVGSSVLEAMQRQAGRGCAPKLSARGVVVKTIPLNQPPRHRPRVQVPPKPQTIQWRPWGVPANAYPIGINVGNHWNGVAAESVETKSESPEDTDTANHIKLPRLEVVSGIISGLTFNKESSASKRNHGIGVVEPLWERNSDIKARLAESKSENSAITDQPCSSYSTENSSNMELYDGETTANRSNTEEGYQQTSSGQFLTIEPENVVSEANAGKLQEVIPDFSWISPDT